MKPRERERFFRKQEKTEKLRINERIRSQIMNEYGGRKTARRGKERERNEWHGGWGRGDTCPRKGDIIDVNGCNAMRGERLGVGGM